MLLATDDKGWLGSGMDDIFEHRIRITNQPVQLNKCGLIQIPARTDYAGRSIAVCNECRHTGREG